jgi:hypothetical protein
MIHDVIDVPGMPKNGCVAILSSTIGGKDKRKVGFLHILSTMEILPKQMGR